MVGEVAAFLCAWERERVFCTFVFEAVLGALEALFAVVDATNEVACVGVCAFMFAQVAASFELATTPVDVANILSEL